MVGEECQAVRERVGVMDLSGFGKVDVSGPDAASFLDRVIANRVPKQAGRHHARHMLNERGTIEAEVTCTHIEPRPLLSVVRRVPRAACRRLADAAIRPGEQVTVENVSKDYGCLVLSGPNAREVLRQTTQAPLDNDSFPWLKAKEISVAGVPVRALRVSYVGELGWELHVPMEHMLDVYDALWEAGQSYGIANFGSYALNAMRLEKGFKGASELTNEVTCQRPMSCVSQARQGRFHRARCDAGQHGRHAAVEVRVSRGRRRWCRLQRERGGRGRWASRGRGDRGAYGHHVSQSLAFAYVEPVYAAPGRTLDVMILGEPRTARVLDRAMYDPDNQRPRM